MGVREVFLAKCQDNQKCFSRMQSLEPEKRALPLTLENPELDFQGLICPSIKAVLVSLCSWFIPLRLLGLKKALWKGVAQNSFLLDLSFWLVTFLLSLKPKKVYLVPGNLLQEKLRCSFGGPA